MSLCLIGRRMLLVQRHVVNRCVVVSYRMENLMGWAISRSLVRLGLVMPKRFQQIRWLDNEWLPVKWRLRFVSWRRIRSWWRSRRIVILNLRYQIVIRLLLGWIEPWRSTTTVIRLNLYD